MATKVKSPRGDERNVARRAHEGQQYIAVGAQPSTTRFARTCRAETENFREAISAARAARAECRRRDAVLAGSRSAACRKCRRCRAPRGPRHAETPGILPRRQDTQAQTE